MRGNAAWLLRVIQPRPELTFVLLLSIAGCYRSGDSSQCRISCPEGWDKICYGNLEWCISPFQGMGDCCQAWQTCTSQGAYPGFWPNEGPYDGVLPRDFSEHVELPTVVMVHSKYQPDDHRFALEYFSCFDENGSAAGNTKETGSSARPEALCGNEGCREFGDGICSDDPWGCLCTMPFWCETHRE